MGAPETQHPKTGRLRLVCRPELKTRGKEEEDKSQREENGCLVNKCLSCVQINLSDMKVIFSISSLPGIGPLLKSF